MNRYRRLLSEWVTSKAGERAADAFVIGVLAVGMLLFAMGVIGS